MKKEKKKERHIVSWSQEEDDILREQIHLHGSENWAIIASKFKDKTTRQCRRRWFTYLNSDFKKGGWSPEEDILLCEAQRMYGNRWTEIAKVVSGRTDNAVKNRFTTLCKKRAKAKLNSTTSFVNLNNKRVILRRGLNSEQGSKKIRACISSITEIPKEGERSGGECGAADQSVENGCLSTFLDKDDPKVQSLMQQAQLLSSVAIKVNMDTTDQSVQSAWMVLEDFLKQNKESGLVKTTNKDTEFRLEKFNIPRDNKEECDAVPLDTGHVLQEKKLDQHCLSEGKGECHMASTNEVKTMPTDVKAGNAEFSSPTHVTPLFRTLAAAIPTPEFSESEKHFLMKTLGLESTSPGPTTNPSPPPTCKRSLLHCL